MSTIFVFGSNEAGRHGKGAALAARQHYGAIYGQAYGRQGNSFAIPTKDENLRTLPLRSIETYVNYFMDYVRANPQLTFFVTRVGCGLAGYQESDIRPLFDSNITRLGEVNNTEWNWNRDETNNSR